MTDNDNNEEITSTQKKNCKLAQENFENKNVFLNTIYIHSYYFNYNIAFKN